MANWVVVLAGIILLIIVYFLVYPQSVFYAAIIGVIGVYALVSGFDISGLFTRSPKKP